MPTALACGNSPHLHPRSSLANRRMVTPAFHLVVPPVPGVCPLGRSLDVMLDELRGLGRDAVIRKVSGLSGFDEYILDHFFDGIRK